jgi:hypothetical protein
MLVQFLRDVVIVVALLAGVIAFALRPAQDNDSSLRAAPSIDIGSAPAVAGSAEGVAMQPSVASPAPQH